MRATRWAAPVDGAGAVGEAQMVEERLFVRIAVWTGGGRVEHARFRATTCATLLALTDVFLPETFPKL